MSQFIHYSAIYLYEPIHRSSGVFFVNLRKVFHAKGQVCFNISEIHYVFFEEHDATQVTAQSIRGSFLPAKD